MTMARNEKLTDPQTIRRLQTEARYSGYIARQTAEINRTQSQQNLRLPATINYQTVRGLSNEARQKLTETKPQTLGQASRIPGVTPAAISLLLVHIKKEKEKVAA